MSSAQSSLVGERIREERERAGLTQTDLGKLVGVTQQSVQKWERGGNITAKRLERVADALHLPVGVLLGEPINSVYISHTEGDLAVADAVERLAEVARGIDLIQRLSVPSGDFELAALRAALERMSVHLEGLEEAIEVVADIVDPDLQKTLESLNLAGLAESLSAAVAALDNTRYSVRTRPLPTSDELIAAKGAGAKAPSVEELANRPSPEPEDA